MTNIEVVVLAGAMPSSVAITIDALGTANRLRSLASRPPAFSLKISGSGARGAKAWAPPEVMGAMQGKPEVVVVPGLGLSTRVQVETRLQMPDVSRARAVLKNAASRDCEIATSCSGSFLLASTGLLDGRRATTSWWLAALFRELHPSVTLDDEALVVRDGPFTTAARRWRRWT